MKKIIIIFLGIIITVTSFGAIASTENPKFGYFENVTKTEIFATSPIKKRARNYWKNKIKNSDINYKDILGPLNVRMAFKDNESKIVSLGKQQVTRLTKNLTWEKTYEEVEEIGYTKIMEYITSNYLVLINNLLETNTSNQYEIFEDYFAFDKDDEKYRLVLEVKNYIGHQHSFSHVLVLDFKLKKYGHIEYILSSAETYLIKINPYDGTKSKKSEYYSEEALLTFAKNLREMTISEY